MVCDHCEGTGTVDAIDTSRSPRYGDATAPEPSYTLEPCSACHGTGHARLVGRARLAGRRYTMAHSSDRSSLDLYDATGHRAGTIHLTRDALERITRAAA